MVNYQKFIATITLTLVICASVHTHTTHGSNKHHKTGKGTSSPSENSCQKGVQASIRFSRRIAIILYMEKAELSQGLDQIKCISDYLKQQNTVRHRCMLRSLEKNFRKAFYLINLKGFGYFKKLREQRRHKRYIALKKKIEED